MILILKFESARKRWWCHKYQCPWKLWWQINNRLTKGRTVNLQFDVPHVWACAIWKSTTLNKAILRGEKFFSTLILALLTLIPWKERFQFKFGTCHNCDFHRSYVVKRLLLAYSHIERIPLDPSPLLGSLHLLRLPTGSLLQHRQRCELWPLMKLWSDMFSPICLEKAAEGRGRRPRAGESEEWGNHLQG